MASQEEKTPMERLPIELRQHILASVGDVVSIINAASACRSFNEAFTTAKQHLLTTALIQTIGFHILPDAVPTYKCEEKFHNTPVNRRELTEPERQLLTDYATEYLTGMTRPDPFSLDWSVRDAVKIQRLHAIVTDLTQRFIEYCAPNPHSPVRIQESFHAIPPSETEKARITRAFYRFELYCRLFGAYITQTVSDQFRTAFLCTFSAYENAQIACVHDFLGRLIAPAYNDVAKHNIVYGRHRAMFNADLSSAYVQNLLSMGIADTYDLATTTTYAERERLLTDGDYPPELHYSFLHKVLTCMTEVPEEYSDSFGLEEMIEQPPFYDDGDYGPKKLWKLSWEYHKKHELDGIENAAIYHPNDWTYRRWGYVMWDKARLDWLFEGEAWYWNPFTSAENNEEVPSFNEMHVSWNARVEIFLRGGRGWRSEEDSSRVIWTR